MARKHRPQKQPPLNPRILPSTSVSAEPPNILPPVAPPKVEDPPKDDEWLHKDAFWLYGVIVGLAIKEALTEVLPHIFSLPKPGVMPAPYGHFLEASRLLVFLVLIIRFYLGSVTYFRDAYTCPSAKDDYSKKNYLIDFLIGFLHFLLFFALASSINIHEKILWLFPLLTGAILSYDLLWLIINWGNDTAYIIRFWTVINIITLGISAGLYYILKGNGVVIEQAEEIASVPVFIASLIDIAGIITNKRLFVSWIEGLVSLLQRLLKTKPE